MRIISESLGRHGTNNTFMQSYQSQCTFSTIKQIPHSWAQSSRPAMLLPRALKCMIQEGARIMPQESSPCQIGKSCFGRAGRSRNGTERPSQKPGTCSLHRCALPCSLPRSKVQMFHIPDSCSFRSKLSEQGGNVAIQNLSIVPCVLASS